MSPAVGLVYTPSRLMAARKELGWMPLLVGGPPLYRRCDWLAHECMVVITCCSALAAPSASPLPSVLSVISLMFRMPFSLCKNIVHRCLSGPPGISSDMSMICELTCAAILALASSLRLQYVW